MPSLRRLLALPILLPLAIGCAGSGQSYLADSERSSPKGTGFLQKTTKAGVKYAVFIPHSYDKTRKYPTIVFLHGLFEGGSDGAHPLTVGLGPAIRKREATFPFIAIFPQSTGAWHADRENLVLETLDRTAAEYTIDPDRVYLTGLSSGGEGTWIIGADHNDRFAALVPMCGYAAYDRVPELTHTPIWAFHNALDPLVPSPGTSGMVDRINAAGGHAKLTSPPVPLHDCWTSAYNNDDLFTWLLAQHPRSSTTMP